MAKRKQVLSDTPQKRKTVTVGQSKPPRRRRRWIWWGVGGFVGLAIISAIGQALGIIPTAEELDMTRTAEVVEQIAALPTFTDLPPETSTLIPTNTPTSTEQPTVTATSSATSTHSPTPITPTTSIFSQPVSSSPTLSFTPSATVTATTTATASPTSVPTLELPSQDAGSTDFTQSLEEVEGVNINLVSTQLDGVYIEALVDPGYNTLATAEQMFSISQRHVGLDEFSVILDDGNTATDYLWSTSRGQWIITSLSSTVSQSTNLPPTATISLPPQTTLYITNGSVNARPCPRLSDECSPAATLAQGTQVQGVIQVSGDAYQNSTVWWQIDYDNQSLYIHSAFISLQPVTNSNTAPQVTAPPPQGAAPGPRPRNCATAVAMNYTPQQAAYWDHLDQDNDGVACYGD